MSDQTVSRSNLLILQQKWTKLVLLQIFFLTAGTLALIFWWGGTQALRWSSLAVLFSILFFWHLYRRLEWNYNPADDRVLPDLGPGNTLTILRGMLLMLLAGFLFLPQPQGWPGILPGLLYSFAALADLFDGYLARISKHQTRLGEELDVSLDGIGILIASSLLVQYGQVPAWFLLVGLARYLFLGGIWLRKKLGKTVYPLAENSARRPFAGSQMGFAAVVLFPVFSPPGTHLAAALFAIPFLLGFLLDWFTVSGISSRGYINSAHFLDRQLRLAALSGIKTVKLFITSWLPLLLRTALVMLIIVWLQGRLADWFNSSLLSEQPPVQWFAVLLILMLSGLIMSAAGVAGRIAALLVLFALGIHLEFSQLAWIEYLLVLTAVGLFYLGSGPYSLWKPEHKVIIQRLGEN